MMVFRYCHQTPCAGRVIVRSEQEMMDLIVGVAKEDE